VDVLLRANFPLQSFNGSLLERQEMFRGVREKDAMS
jgi:hypothetical protein